MISVFNKQKDLQISKKSASHLIETVLSYLKVPFEEVTLYFVTEKQIAQVHGEFFQDPTPTDCISFPLDEKHLGEVFVCPSIAIKYATKRKLDPYRETALYVIHGLLHLIGYDDLDPKKREAMRKKEKSCMHHLDRNQIRLK